MRAFLYDLLTSDPDLQSDLGGAGGILDRVIPRRSQENILVARPFLIFGLGNSSSEQLVDSTADGPEDKTADRQFFQIWIHDDSMSFKKIDDLVKVVKDLVTGASSTQFRILTIQYLETSQEFSNETYNTLFRYIRFQAIIVPERT